MPKLGFRQYSIEDFLRIMAGLYAIEADFANSVAFVTEFGDGELEEYLRKISPVKRMVIHQYQPDGSWELSEFRKRWEQAVEDRLKNAPSTWADASEQEYCSEYGYELEDIY